jgi:hypothetical protein
MAITIATRDGPGPRAASASRAGSARARAFKAAQRHSGLVRALRVLLPLTAGLVLVAFSVYVAAAWHLQSSKVTISGIKITADDLSMQDPTFTDATSDGRYEVRAKRAVFAFSRQNAPIKLIEISGELHQKGGGITKLKSKNGIYDKAKGELELLDGIEIDGSNGLIARLVRATIFTKESKVVSQHPVSAMTPTGSVEAQALTMHTKTRLAQFRGAVSVRLVASAQTAGIGGDKGKPVDVRSEELDVDDAQKTAHFRGKVVALQGDTMLQAPYLMVKYEGKAAAALEAKPKAQDGKAGPKEGTRVSFLWVRNGAEITAGNDRRITSELVDFDVAADTAKFEGKVIAVQDKNVLKGERLTVDRKGGTSRLEAEDGGRIFATFYQPAGAQGQRSKTRPAAELLGAMGGSFKNDPNAPMEIEADTLDVNDAAKKAVFKGDVKARQGDMLLLASELTAFFAGSTGLGLATAADDAGAKAKGADKSEIVRLEARKDVLLTAKDGQTAGANAATFDVKANTALLVGDVLVTKPTADPKDPQKQKANVLEAPRLKIDLTTGIYWMESDPAGPAKEPKGETPPKGSESDPAPSPPASTKAEGRTCPPGRVCGLLYPPTRDKALDSLKKKKAPPPDAQ